MGYRILIRVAGALPYVVAAAVIGGMAWLEWQAWAECRAVFSWFYCFRTLGNL